MEGAVRGEESIGGEDMQVGMEEEVVPEGVDGSDSAEFSIGEVEAEAEVIPEALAGGGERRVRRWRRLRKMPRRTLGMVKTNWQCGTSWQTAVAIHSLVPRTRRWWQDGQKWRDLQVKARRRSWPQSGH